MNKSDLESLAVELRTDMKWIKNKIDPLCRQVEANTKWRYKLTGGLAILSFIIGMMGAKLIGI